MLPITDSIGAVRTRSKYADRKLIPLAHLEVGANMLTEN